MILQSIRFNKHITYYSVMMLLILRELVYTCIYFLRLKQEYSCLSEYSLGYIYL